MLTGERFGRYEIRAKIGEGGMGEVYSATDPALDRDVAIKLLPNEFTEDEDRRTRFRQEAKVVSALNHPNVITIYEIGENDFGHFLATEYVEGRTLREIIKRAMDLGAAAIIVVHNHPSGDPKPSRADIDITRLLADAGKKLGVTLHDHLIIAANGHASMKALGLM